MDIKIQCKGTVALPLDQLKLPPGKTKKHSQLEITRVGESIKKLGFLFPLNVVKWEGNYYVVDGEARLKALQELVFYGYEVEEIPCSLIRCRTEEELKRLVLISVSTNHAVTQVSLENLVRGTEMEGTLAEYGFPSIDLLDFKDPADMGLYVETTGGKDVAPGVTLSEEQFLGSLL